MFGLPEIIIVVLVIIVSITEFFYPLIAGKPFFGTFRKIRRKSRPGEEKKKT